MRNKNNIGPAHSVTAQFSIIYISFQKFRFENKSPAAVEISSDKTIQSSRLKSLKKTRQVFSMKLFRNVPHVTWKEFLSTSRKTFLQKYENLFPKAYVQRLEIHFQQHRPNFFNSIFRGTTFLYKIFRCTPKTKFWQISCQMWSNSSRKKTWRPATSFPTKLSRKLDSPFDNTDRRPFGRNPKKSIASWFCSKKTAHLFRVFDNIGQRFCAQSSEETHFYSKNLTFTTAWECIFDKNTILATNSGQFREKLI